MSTTFCVEYARTGRATCKDSKCKQKIEKGALRVGKQSPSFFDPDEMMTVWYHPACIFNAMMRAKKWKIESLDDLDGMEHVKAHDKATLEALLVLTLRKLESRGTGKKKKKQPRVTQFMKRPAAAAAAAAAAAPAAAAAAAAAAPARRATPNARQAGGAGGAGAGGGGRSMKPASGFFSSFTRLCRDVNAVPSTTEKVSIMRKTFASFDGDLQVLVRLLLPREDKRVYNLKEKQLIKVLAPLLGCSTSDLTRHAELGDISATVSKFFKSSMNFPPAVHSTLSLFDVNGILNRLSKATQQADQTDIFGKLLEKCTPTDIKWIIRLIKRDLKIGVQGRKVLTAVHPKAWDAYSQTSDLAKIVARYRNRIKEGFGAGVLQRQSSMGASLMTPVKPMLARPCKSFLDAVKRCPNGMFAEIKYDGERIQIHKNGDKFQYFSRSLKPVQPHKVREIEQYIPKAFPTGHQMILDAEILLCDTDGKPLPFGTLGIHKKRAFADATVCIFVFDILHLNGEDLMKKGIKARRRLLEKAVREIPGRVRTSEMTIIRDEDVLKALMQRAMDEGLEGLVLKDQQGVYEPGKRHWLKMKKDYLADGAMADTADLVVLGANFGTGSKGGIMSVFLMGCYDANGRQWRTVCKCGNGHDDATLARLNKTLKVTKIFRDRARVPGWLRVNSSLVPDFVVQDPWSAPVWEITGSEFSASNAHTADGISIRFPRVTRERTDKGPRHATSLAELKALVEASGQSESLKLNAKKKDTDADAIAAWSFIRKTGAADEDEDEEEDKGQDGGDDRHGISVDVVDSDVDTVPDEDEHKGSSAWDLGDDLPTQELDRSSTVELVGDGADTDSVSTQESDGGPPVPPRPLPRGDNVARVPTMIYAGNRTGGDDDDVDTETEAEDEAEQEQHQDVARVPSLPSTVVDTRAAAPAAAFAADDDDDAATVDSSDGSDDEDVEVDNRPACQYGARCYRRNPKHFEEYYHAHLDGDRKQSRQRRMTGGKRKRGAPAPTRRQKKRKNKTRKKKKRCPYGKRCFRKNPAHIAEYSHDASDDDSDDSDGVDARNIVQGRRKRQRVNYAEPDSDESWGSDDE